MALRRQFDTNSTHFPRSYFKGKTITPCSVEIHNTTQYQFLPILFVALILIPDFFEFLRCAALRWCEISSSFKLIRFDYNLCRPNLLSLVVSLAPLVEMARGNGIAPLVLSTMIVSVDNECGRSFQNRHATAPHVQPVRRQDRPHLWLRWWRQVAGCMPGTPPPNNACIGDGVGGISTEMGGLKVIL